MTPPEFRSSVIPGLRYHDAHAAIDWLCNVLGFERRLVVAGEGGSVAHAQLTLGSGMIMLGSVRDDPFGEIVTAATPAGTLTQSAYIVVSDIETCYERVKAAGADVVIELSEPDYGGSFFSVRDPEGQLWNVGTYDPWAEPG